MEEIGRWRKPTVIAVIVVFVASMIVWPLLMLPAGDNRQAGLSLLFYGIVHNKDPPDLWAS